MGKTSEFLSTNLRRIRKDRKMTQTQLADAVGVGMLAIQRIEAGARFPRSDTLTAIAQVLNVTESDLLKDPSAPDAQSNHSSLLGEAVTVLTTLNDDQLRTVISLATEMSHLNTGRNRSSNVG